MQLLYIIQYTFCLGNNYDQRNGRVLDDTIWLKKILLQLWGGRYIESTTKNRSGIPIAEFYSIQV
jgi:hypothetical protein